MKLELTISGLWVLAVKTPGASDLKPKKPVRVDVIVPDAHMHRTLLNYYPEDFKTQNNDAEMTVGVDGKRVAALPMHSDFLEFAFTNSPVTEFSMDWGDASKETPPTVADETWMHWVPTFDELGFKPFAMPKSPKRPFGAGTRLKLPPGKIEARSVIHTRRRRGRGPYATWEFPAASTPGLVKALANEIVYTVEGAAELHVQRNGKLQLRSLNAGEVHMCMSNDLAISPMDYNDPQDELVHLEHFDELADLKNEPFKPPKLKTYGRTGRPICNGSVFVYSEGGDV